MALLLAGRGQVDEAIAHYRKALEIKPDYAEAHNNLGTALAARGQVNEAIAHFQKALEIKPDFAEVHYNLGVALHQQGHTAEAMVHYHKALELAVQQKKQALAESIKAKLLLDTAGHPFRDTPSTLAPAPTSP